MTAEPDLLPCPFCGGTPVLRVPQITDGYAVHIRCRCGVELYGSRSHFATGGEAITAWNRRATAARDAEVEALRAEASTAHDAVLYHIAEHAKTRARAERLAEALREIANQGPHYGPDGTYKTWRHWAEIARAALEQEAGRG